ncbi:MAG: hypothetical protein RBR71_13880 [Gudongella sp.]|nr:hypothetical protein [Gudongella sp.]
MFINLLIKFINVIVDGLASLVNLLFMLLPNSPFQTIDLSTVPYLNTLNWFIPIDFMILTLTAWTTAIALYYVVMVALRWAKAIE